MPLDSLPSHNLQIPEFKPAIVTQLPKPSPWAGIAQGVAGGAGVLAKALDPVEKAKEKLSLAQLSFQTKALEDFQKGNPSDYYMGPNGLPVRLTQIQKQQMEARAQNIEKSKLWMAHSKAVEGANKGDPNFTHASEFESQLPQDNTPLTAPDLPPDGTGANNYGVPGAPKLDALPNSFAQ